VYNIIGTLRKKGYHCEGITSTDRSYPFKQERLDYDDIAQTYVILQQMFSEMKQHIRDDIDFFISDRSAFDFFAYYEYCIKDNNHKKMIKNIIKEWIKSYDYIFVYKPLPYVSDGKRPNDEFRINIDKQLMSMVEVLIKLKYPIEIVKGKTSERDKYVMDKIITIEK